MPLAWPEEDPIELLVPAAPDVPVIEPAEPAPEPVALDVSELVPEPMPELVPEPEPPDCANEG